MEFIHAEVFPAKLATETNQSSRNLEAVARDLRYDALARICNQIGVHTLATAHHADDQAETVLMRIMRGTSIRGLRGIASHSKRMFINELTSIPHAITLIRPMLGVSRGACERICKLAGWDWNLDATNADTTRTRSWLRHDILPTLDERLPGAQANFASLAEHAADLVRAVEPLVKVVWDQRHVEGDAIQWARGNRSKVKPINGLRHESAYVVAEVLHRAIRSVTKAKSMDAIGSDSLRNLVTLVHDAKGHPRRVTLGRAVVHITRYWVRIEPVAKAQWNQSRQ